MSLGLCWITSLKNILGIAETLKCGVCLKPAIHCRQKKDRFIAPSLSPMGPAFHSYTNTFSAEFFLRLPADPLQKCLISRGRSLKKTQDWILSPSSKVSFTKLIYFPIEFIAFSLDISFTFQAINLQTGSRNLTGTSWCICRLEAWMQ